MRTLEDIKEYVEYQSNQNCKVLSAKPEHTYNDLGTEVRVWNVKTDVEGMMWVVEGDDIPMNLYSQDAYYFGVDEVYSFHMGLMMRMEARQDDYIPENYLNAVSVETEIVPQLLRKLKVISTLIDTAIEIEDFQSIGVQCREVLIELGNYIFKPFMKDGNEELKASDFKKKSELFMAFYYGGQSNKDYRTIYKKMTESTWDFANKITHSRSTTFYEVSSCVSMCITIVSIYENVMQKVYDSISQYICKNCKSKKLNIIRDEHDENGVVSKLFMECEECGEITEIVFDTNNNENKYVKGIIKN
ncbi:hypothetical protein [Clostridium botulinum]|uniref:hypothetical protein n=1 Tax=Clostridium botulinum TaxID=1491 RepID=UPI001967D803|nr:hypothetical protein [Clostridium botulinum]MBN1076641.1 hypothetical protein [Clostridium botulinum]